MRVTQRSVHRNYLSSLNRNAKQMNDSTMRMSTGRKFNKISENVSEGARAFKLRREILRAEQYVKNIEDTRDELKVAENGMLNVSSIMTKIEELMGSGMNGTNGPDERRIMANEIGNLMNDIAKIANDQNVDHFIFAGSKNVRPFVYEPVLDGSGNPILDGDGNPVKQWYFQNTIPGSAEYPNPTKIPVSASDLKTDFGVTDRFIDIGFGLSLDASGNIDPNTVTQVSTTGIEVFGYGETNGLPNNIIALAQKIVDDLKNPTFDHDEMQKNLDQFQARRSEFLIQVGDIGNRAKFLDDNQERIESELIDMQTLQRNIEAVSIEEESMYNNSYIYAWQVSLKLAGQILPQSIFDFMR